MSKIKDWPAAERPREKLLDRGPEGLTEAELLALILRTGDAGSGTTAVDQARGLLGRFGSLAELARAGIRDLCRQPGVGPAKAAELQALFELARRLQCQPLRPGARYECAEEVFHHFHARLVDQRREQFLLLLLDSKNRVLREERISEGSLTASIVHPREVFAAAVRESAAALLLIHNHPSGDPTPSREDLDVTRRLAEAGVLMGVRVLDHIIIGRGRYISLAAEGLMAGGKE